MGYFIIGDIHGCYHSFRALLENWDSKKETLVCVGDYIDRGNFSPEVIETCKSLQLEYRERTVFLKGNHELLMQSHLEEGYNGTWLQHGGQGTLDQFFNLNTDPYQSLEWIRSLPVFYETAQLMVTHAGVTHTDYPFFQNNPDGVLWTRGPLKHLNKLQVHGHTPLMAEAPAYTEAGNSWNIDTGACYGHGLTGLKVDTEGTMTEFLFEKTHPQDIG
ncbi:MAG: metallophosphoesterase family protein [Roseivirga sp.]